MPRSPRRRHRAARSAGGVVSITSPAQVSGLTHWYDFSDIASLWQDTGRTSAITADGQMIKGVTDKSGTANHLSEATNGPVYKVNIQNGKSAARSTANAFLTSPVLSADASKTIFFVGNQVVAASATLNMFVEINSVWMGASTGVFSGQQVGFSHLPTAVNFPGSIDCQTPAIYIVRTNAASDGNIYSNAAGPTSGAQHPNWDTAVVLHVMGRNATDAMNGHCYEVVQYDSALSASNMNKVGNYLASKWGLTWTPVA